MSTVQNCQNTFYSFNIGFVALFKAKHAFLYERHYYERIRTIATDSITDQLSLRVTHSDSFKLIKFISLN